MSLVMVITIYYLQCAHEVGDFALPIIIVVHTVLLDPL